MARVMTEEETQQHENSCIQKIGRFCNLTTTFRPTQEAVKKTERQRELEFFPKDDVNVRENLERKKRGWVG